MQILRQYKYTSQKYCPLRRQAGSMTEYAAIFNFIAVIAVYSILSFAGFVEMDYIRIGKCITSIGLGYGQAGCFSEDSSGQTGANSSQSSAAGVESGDPVEQSCNGIAQAGAGTMHCVGQTTQNSHMTNNNPQSMGGSNGGIRGG